MADSKLTTLIPFLTVINGKKTAIMETIRMMKSIHRA